MFGNHFYHETIRRSVSVFGTLFNDINIVRKDNNGEVKSIVKVPLAYGPKQKFLARIEEQANLMDQKVAIKLPRMSFEITTLTYDPAVKLQRGLKTQMSNGTRVMGPVTYRMGMQLNIMAKNQDDALQILEQIIPFFQPDYTVTIKQLDNNIKSDMPFTLQSVSLTDDYEGDFSTRRAIIYTLDFETRVNFYGSVNTNTNTIRKVTVDYNDMDDRTQMERQIAILNPFSAEEDDEYTVDNIIIFGEVADEIILSVADSTDFELGQDIVGTESLSRGYIKAVNDNDNTITVIPDNLFEIGELITVVGAPINTIINGQSEIWYE